LDCWGLPMTTTVGIFDNARDLDKAVERLACAGFDDTVYDEGIVAGEAVNVGSAVFAPGYAPAVVWGSAEPDSPPKADLDTVVRAFKAHLADYHLPKDVIKAYATTFYHNGESSWSNPTPSAPSKSWRSCGIAAPRGLIGMTNHYFFALAMS
jgi:hypothetical protein